MNLPSAIQSKTAPGLLLRRGGALVLLLALLQLLATSALAQSPTFRWASRAGGTGDDFGNAIAVDSHGNSYVVGNFNGAANFGGGENRVIVSRGSSDIFVAKYNDSGGLLWVKQAGGIAEDFGRGISVDAAGNSYVTGYFYSPTITFGNTTLTRTGTSDLFVAKYDPEGNVVWVKSAGGGGGAQANAIAADAAGNSYLTGNYFLNLTFDSGTLTNAGYSDVVIAKHDTDGNLVWARQAGGASDDSGNGIAVDNQGNCYVTGNFSRTIHFGRATMSTGEKPTIFTVKFGSDGRFVWASHTSASGACYSRGVAVDSYGNSYITGSIRGTLSIGGRIFPANGGGGTGDSVERYPSAGVMRGGNDETYHGTTTTGSSGSSLKAQQKLETVNTPINRYGKMDFTDILIVKYDPQGRQEWARICGGPKPIEESGFAIAVDPVGNCYVTGTFSGRALFGGTHILSSAMSEVFITQLDRFGNFIWVRQAGGPSSVPHSAYGIALDLAGNAYITGYFRTDATFGGVRNDGGVASGGSSYLSGGFFLRSAGEADAFVARVSGPFVPARSQ